MHIQTMIALLHLFHWSVLLRWFYFTPSVYHDLSRVQTERPTWATQLSKITIIPGNTWSCGASQSKYHQSDSWSGASLRVDGELHSSLHTEHSITTAFLCSFQTTEFLIKHNLVTISVLFAPLLTRTHSPSPFPGSP